MEPKIVTYTKGYLVVLLKGYSPERFLNICSSHNINIWNLIHTEEGYQFCITIADFRRLKPIVKKTKTKLIIRNRYGFPFFLYKYRKRKLFFAGICLCLGIIYIMSLFIWDIHIEGNYSYTEDVLLDFLKSKDVIHGMKRDDVDCSAIEKMLRSEYNDVTWVSASISGTRLIIRIQENFDNMVMLETDAPSNLVATKDCKITSIVTRSGTPLVKKGDIVAEGDILVSGIVDITDDYGEHIRSEYVGADADVYGEVVYEYEDSQPLFYQKKVYTQNQKIAYAIRAFSNRLYLYAGKINFESFDIETEQNQLHFGSNYYLPFFLEKCYYKEYVYEQVELSKEEVEKILQKNLSNFFENFLKKGVQIVGNNVKIQIDGKKGKASGKVMMIVPVAKTEVIEAVIERDEILNEYNRNNN